MMLISKRSIYGICLIFATAGFAVFTAHRGLGRNLVTQPRISAEPINLKGASKVASAHDLLRSSNDQFVLPIIKSKTLKVYRSHDGSVVRQIAYQPYNNAYPIAFSGAGNKLVQPVAREASQLEVVDIITGQRQQLIQRKDAGKLSALAAAGNLVVLGQQNGKVDVWDLKQQRFVQHFSIADQPVCQLRIATDDSRLSALTRDGTIWQLDIVNGQQKMLLDVRQQSKRCDDARKVIDWRLSGNIATSLDGNVLRLWDLRRKQSLHQISTRDRGIFQAVLSQDGRSVATVSRSKQRGLLTARNYHTVRVWNSQTRQLVGVSGPYEYAMGIRFTADSKHLLTVGRPGVVSRWDLSHLAH